MTAVVVSVMVLAATPGVANAVDDGEHRVTPRPITDALDAPRPALEVNFSDVPDGAWFETPVAWLVQEGITSGVGGNRYGSNDPVTRAQMAAFLHRTAGTPFPVLDHRFSDVPDGSWFDNAVAWLLQEGITSGVGDGRYGANDQVTRAQMAAFLHRAAGSPAVSGSHGFSDVPAGSWYETPVTWLLQEGITSGIGGGKYGPNEPVTRAQMAAFLHRFAGNQPLLADLPFPTRTSFEIARYLTDVERPVPANWDGFVNSAHTDFPRYQRYSALLLDFGAFTIPGLPSCLPMNDGTDDEIFSAIGCVTSVLDENGQEWWLVVEYEHSTPFRRENGVNLAQLTQVEVYLNTVD